MDALDLLAQDNYIIVNKTLIKEIGLENAIVLGVLCGYQRTLGNEFYREQEKIIEDTGLTEYQIRKSIKELQECGFINVVKKGMPCKYYYSINLLKFNFLSSSGAKNDTTSGADFDTTCDYENDTTNNNKNKYNKNKYNKNNIKHKYGENGKVILTIEQYQRLCDDFGTDYVNAMIDKLDEYVAMNNNKNGYKDFNLVIRKAIREKWFKLDFNDYKEKEDDLQPSFNELDKIWTYEDELHTIQLMNDRQRKGALERLKNDNPEWYERILKDLKQKI